MSLPPIVERELRVAFRRQQPVKRRLSLTAGAGGVTALFILLGAIGGPSTKTLHWLLFLYGLLIALKALQFSASLFSEERRNQTLELLFLAGISAPQLFITKLIGGLLIASSDLIAIMPFLSIPFLAGGLSLQLFIATLVTLPTLLLFAVSVGVLASVICHEDGTAMLAGAVIIAVLCFLTPVPYNLGLALTSRAPFPSFWLCLSPAYAPWLISRSFGSTFPPNFWPALGTTVSWSLLCLAAAATILRLNWRSEPAQNVGFWRRTWQLWVHGSEQWRLRLRHRRLKANPFCWRIEQDRRPAVLAWIVVISTIVLWLAAWGTWPTEWLSTTSFLTTAVVTVIALYWLQLHSAAQYIARERCEGTFELLLTTAIAPNDILDGLQKASGNQFRPPRQTAFIFFLVMMLVGFFVQTWNTAAVAVYIILWAILCWFVISGPRNTVVAAAWVALVSGRAGYALRRIHNFNYVSTIWMLFLLGNFMRTTLGSSSTPFPEGTLVEVIVIPLAGLFVLIGSLIRWGGTAHWEALFADMRVIAQRPIPDPQDPRFRKWKDIKQPFPAAD